jgi:8-oxo-dGTP diphosphatase
MDEPPERGLMVDWDKAPVFGAPTGVKACVIRKSAYGIVTDEHGRLAVVRTGQGMFLPGGGIEAGETPEEAIMREVIEECGLVIRLGVWTAHAIQFVYSESEQTHFEKRSTFIDGTVDEACLGRLEADHELVWISAASATEMLSHQSQCWAVKRWRSRNT